MMHGGQPLSVGGHVAVCAATGGSTWPWTRSAVISPGTTLEDQRSDSFKRGAGATLGDEGASRGICLEEVSARTGEGDLEFDPRR